MKNIVIKKIVEWVDTYYNKKRKEKDSRGILKF
jgi:hypothetical protein